MRVLGPNDRLRGMTEPESGGANSPKLSIRPIRHIHVEDQGTLERLVEKLPHEPSRDLGAGIEVPRTARVRAQRDRDRRQPEEAAFDGCCDGARVEHVVSEIGAIVDARHHHVVLVIEQPRDRQMHAVGRSSRHVVNASLGFVHPQGHIECQGIAGTTAIAVGGDDGDLGDGQQRLAQAADSLGAVTIVIADQYLHTKVAGVGGLEPVKGASLYCSVNPKLDEDDARLFREAVRDVKPLAQGGSAGAPRRPSPEARFTRADRFAVLQESLRPDAADPELAGGEELVFHREGVHSTVLRKLRRGQYRVQGEIDLHGLNVTEAKQALREFIANALVRELKCVRIIHGKGLRSGHRGPVLKGTVSSVLRRIGPVLAYVSARPVDGGTGAVYVLLATWGPR